MLKGAQKKMIVVKTQDSKVFEEAYFVMRTDTAASGEDMVSEANRIIEKCCEKRRDKRRRIDASVLVPVCAFMLGSIIGAAIAVLFVIIV